MIELLKVIQELEQASYNIHRQKVEAGSQSSEEAFDKSASFVLQWTQGNGSVTVDMLRWCPVVGALVLVCCHAARTGQDTQEKRAQNTVNGGVLVQHTDRMMACGKDGKSCLFRETLTLLCWLIRTAGAVSEPRAIDWVGDSRWSVSEGLGPRVGGESSKSGISAIASRMMFFFFFRSYWATTGQSGYAMMCSLPTVWPVPTLRTVAAESKTLRTYKSQVLCWLKWTHTVLVSLKTDYHSFVTLGNLLLDSGLCPALVSQCLWKQKSDPSLDSPGRMKHPNPTREIALRSGFCPSFLSSLPQGDSAQPFGQTMNHSVDRRSLHPSPSPAHQESDEDWQAGPGGCDGTGATHTHKKTKYACIVEAHESTKNRLESTLQRNHEDHFAEKGDNSINQYNLSTNSFLCLERWKVRMRKLPWRKNGKSSRKFQPGSWINEKQERCFLEEQKR